MTTNSKMRSDFEAWYCNKFTFATMARSTNGEYCGEHAFNAWITWQAALSQPPSQAIKSNEIIFGDGKIGVHTELQSERKAIWLSILGSGVVDAPTNHPDATSISPDHVLSVMVFKSKESCNVLIEALANLYQEPQAHVSQPEYEAMRLRVAELEYIENAYKGLELITSRIIVQRDRAEYENAALKLQLAAMEPKP